MRLNVQRRVWQAALTLSALLITLLAPLSGSASYAAAPSTSDTTVAAKAIAPGSAEQTTTGAFAAVPGAALPTSTQFDLTGFLQAATLGGPGTGPGLGAHQGGTLTVNGHVVIVPSETIVILPANALTWQELFAQSPAPYTGVATGLALADIPAPISTYEVHVVGNRVVQAGQDRYIAGLINISQQDLNTGAGYINFIDYDVGANHEAELRIGGLMNDPNCVAAASNPAAGGLNCSGARVRLNDPAIDNDGDGVVDGGRFGRAQTPDARFTVDPDNPTIASATGYPMCIPRVLSDPTASLPAALPAAASDDAECPAANRAQRFGDLAGTFSLLSPTTPGGFSATTNTIIPGGVTPGYIHDASKQAPIEVGDYVTFAGTLVNDTATPTVAVPGATTYISAHTISDNFAAYTQPGLNPAYVTVEVSLIGTGGLTVFGAGEAAIRTRIEGMTTDPTRNVRVYAVDINPITGALMDRDWGMVSPDPGPPNGAVMGRWRLRPPCTGTLATVSDKLCVAPASGNYTPPPRELRAVVDGTSVSNTVTPAPAPPISGAGFVAPISAASPRAANGIVYGQYHAPIDEYIFPENIPGNPIVSNNFESIPFLAYGGYTSAGGTQVGQLNPWPGAITPAVPVCVANTTTGPYSVIAGGAITLAGSVSGIPAGSPTTPITLQWTKNVAGGTLTNATTTTPTFSAGALAVGTVVNVTFTATNVCGPSVATTTITVVAAPPTITLAAASQAVLVGTPTVTLSASSPSAGPLSFQFTQTSGTPVVLPGGGLVAGVASGVPATVTFATPAAPTVLTFSVTATNVNGTSAPSTATVTVNAAAANIAITTAEYRIGNQRLSLTVASADPPASVLTLRPYLTVNGTVFDPATLGNTLTNTGGGIYTMTLVGAPRPACNPGGAFATPCSAAPLVVVSSGGGTSSPSALTRIRQ